MSLIDEVLRLSEQLKACSEAAKTEGQWLVYREMQLLKFQVASLMAAIARALPEENVS